MATWSQTPIMNEGMVASGGWGRKYSHNSGAAPCCGLTSYSCWATKRDWEKRSKRQSLGQQESDIVNSCWRWSLMFIRAWGERSALFLHQKHSGNVSCVDSCFIGMGWLISWTMGSDIYQQVVMQLWEVNKWRVCAISLKSDYGEDRQPTLFAHLLYCSFKIQIPTTLRALLHQTDVHRSYLTFLGGFNNIR